MSSDSNKKTYKRPKLKTLATTNPESSKLKVNRNENKGTVPLLAKDSEWVDILQTPLPEASQWTSNVSDDEDVLQLVESEEGPEMKPLALMFPGLLEKDPEIIQGVLDKVMSTTEVTRHLVDLGQKANFTFMKKANRLIPNDKQWLESLTEDTNSYCSMESNMFSNNITSNTYDADSELIESEEEDKKRNNILRKGMSDRVNQLASKSKEDRIGGAHNMKNQ